MNKNQKILSFLPTGALGIDRMAVGCYKTGAAKLLSSLFKTIFFQLIFDKEKKDIYLNRLSGITNSILGKKSWRRPTID